MIKSHHYVSALLAVQCLTAVAASHPIASWTFDTLITSPAGEQAVVEDIGAHTNSLIGNGWLAPGVKGNALVLDGITAHVLCKAASAPKLSGAFTVEAWIAMGAYPFNWCPILQQQDGEKAGFFLGVGDKGQLTFKLVADGAWQGIETKEYAPLRSWTHVAGVYEPGQGLTIYLNGRAVASQAIRGKFMPAHNADLWIGRNMNDLEQTSPVGKNKQFPTRIVFDGMMDELTISSCAKSATELAEMFGQQKPSVAPALEARILPAGVAGPFGAYYARLKYYKGWDDYWRVGDSPDVVVRFDESPYRFVFWRGTSYIPHWVTENGIWYDNEFTETFQKGLQGSAEPMSDKQCRYSHVRILESSPARAVVHWRYAPVDVNYTSPHVDPLSGWGDWTDEIYTLYPDGIGIRKITVHSSGINLKREWHEGIVVMSPGMSPNDAIEPAGLTLVNSKGETHTYSWQDQTPPKKPTDLPDANLQLINTKSKYKPFTAVRTEDKPWFDVYAGEIRRDVSIYPWWNHWPTAFEPSNGRYAQAADRASHSSLTHIHWDEYAIGDNWATKIMLHGMTDRPAAELAAISRSWENPAKLKLVSDGFTGGDFDQAERAYILSCTSSPAQKPLAFTIDGSTASPIHNLAFVIKNWGDADAILTLDGHVIGHGSDFRSSIRQTLEGSDLIVWIKAVTTKPVKISLTPKS